MAECNISTPNLGACGGGAACSDDKFDAHIDLKVNQFYRVYPSRISGGDERPQIMMQLVSTESERTHLIRTLDRLPVYGLKAVVSRQFVPGRLYLVKTSGQNAKYRRMVFLDRLLFRDLDVNGCDYCYTRISADIDTNTVSQVFEFPDTGELMGYKRRGAYLFECAVDEEFWRSTQSAFSELSWAEMIIQITRKPNRSPTCSFPVNLDDLPTIKWYSKCPAPARCDVLSEEASMFVPPSDGSDATGRLYEGRFRSAFYVEKGGLGDADIVADLSLTTKFFFLPDCHVIRRNSITRQLSTWADGGSMLRYMRYANDTAHDYHGNVCAFRDRTNGQGSWRRVYVLKVSLADVTEIETATVALIDFGGTCELDKREIVVNVPTDIKAEPPCAMYCKLAHIEHVESKFTADKISKNSRKLKRLLVDVESSDHVQIMVHARLPLPQDQAAYWSGYKNPIREPYIASLYYYDDQQNLLISLEEQLTIDPWLFRYKPESFPDSWCRAVPLVDTDQVYLRKQASTPPTFSSQPSTATVAFANGPEDLWLHFGPDHEQVLAQLENFYVTFPRLGLRINRLSASPQTIQRNLPGYPVVVKMKIRESDESETICRGEIVKWSLNDHAAGPLVKLIDYPMISLVTRKSDILEAVASDLLQTHPSMALHCRLHGWERGHGETFDANKFAALFFKSNSTSLSSVKYTENKVLVIFFPSNDFPSDRPLYNVVLLNRCDGSPVITDAVAAKIGLERFGNATTDCGVPRSWLPSAPNSNSQTKVFPARIIDAINEDGVILVTVQHTKAYELLTEQSTQMGKLVSTSSEQCHQSLKALRIDGIWYRVRFRNQDEAEMADTGSVVCPTSAQLATSRPVPLGCCALPFLVDTVKFKLDDADCDVGRAMDCFKWILSQQDDNGNSFANEAVIDLDATGMARIWVKFTWPLVDPHKNKTSRHATDNVVLTEETKRKVGDYYYLNEMLRCFSVPRPNPECQLSMKPTERPLALRRLDAVPVPDAYSDTPLLEGEILNCSCTPWLFFLRPSSWKPDRRNGMANEPTRLDQIRQKLDDEYLNNSDNDRVASADQLKVGHDYLCLCVLRNQRSLERVRVLYVTPEEKATEAGKCFDAILLDEGGLLFNMHYSHFYRGSPDLMREPSLVLPCGELRLRPMNITKPEIHHWLQPNVPASQIAEFSKLRGRTVVVEFLRDRRVCGVYPVAIKWVIDGIGGEFGSVTRQRPIHNDTRSVGRRARVLREMDIPATLPTRIDLPPHSLSTNVNPIFPAFVERVTLEPGTDGRPSVFLRPTVYANHDSQLQILLSVDCARIMEPMHTDQIDTGVLCVVYFEQKWRRAEIVGQVTAETCQLSLIDDGRLLANWSLNDIFVGHPDLWTYLPPMLLKVNLFQTGEVLWTKKLAAQLEKWLKADVRRQQETGGTATAVDSGGGTLFLVVDGGSSSTLLTVRVSNPNSSFASNAWMGVDEFLKL